MPTTETVPSGPRRDLITDLHTLYQATGGLASTREISRWTGEFAAADQVSHSLIGTLMSGRVRDRLELPGLDKVLSVARALARHATDGDAGRLDEARLRNLWQQVRQPEVHAETRQKEARVRPVATETGMHVARAAFRRGLTLAGDQMKFAQGAVGIAAVDPDPGICRRVFDQAFQGDLSLQQELKYLRRDGHGFDTQYLWTPSSFIVHGPISGSRGRSYVAIEVTVHGTVGVYYREDTRSRTLDEFVAFNVHGAWAVGFDALRTLGLFGKAWGATLIDHRGIAELAPRRSESHGRWIHDRHASVVSHGLVELIEGGRYPLDAAAAQRDTAHQLLSGLRSSPGTWNPDALRQNLW